MTKNVVFVIHSMDNAGGSERVTSNLVNFLSENLNYRVTILALYGKGESYFKLSSKVKLINIKSAVDKLPIKAYHLIRLINSIRPSHIVGISIGKLNLFLGCCSFFFRSGIKLIASEHISYSSSISYLNKLKSLIYHRFDSVLVLTNYDKILMEKRGFKNLNVMPNASTFYPDRKDIKPILDRDKLVIAVGRLTNQKGFDMLIEAWRKVSRSIPLWKLLIVGEGEERKNLIELLEKKDLSNAQCEIVPFSRNIEDLYNRAQIFVLSSRFEGLPMVMIEAMCSGCPIVAFDCKTGPKEIITDQENGFLVEEDNVEMLANKILQLALDEKIRLSFMEKAVESRYRFSVDHIMDRWKVLLS